MKVKASQLIKMFVALGVDTAAASGNEKGWDFKKLKSKVEGGVKKFKEGDAELPDKELNDLYEDIVTLQAKDTHPEIEDDLTVEKPKKKEAAAEPEPEAAPKKRGRKPATESGGTPKAPREQPKWNDLAKVWEKRPQQLTDKGPGVIKFIVEELKEAGRKNRPITKENLLEKMKTEFPDRDPAKMETTLNNQIPARLLLCRHIYVWKGLTTDKTKIGYYINGDGYKPQPKNSIPERPKAPPKPKPEKPVSQETIARAEKVAPVAGTKPKKTEAKKGGGKGAAAPKKAAAKKGPKKSAAK